LDCECHGLRLGVTAQETVSFNTANYKFQEEKLNETITTLNISMLQY